jgi:hypothetical protein
MDTKSTNPAIIDEYRRSGRRRAPMTGQPGLADHPVSAGREIPVVVRTPAARYR